MNTSSTHRSGSDCHKVRAFAPATVSNVGCGFDALGFAVDRPGDTVEAWERPEAGIEIVGITGDDGRLPREATRNTAGVAVAELLRSAGCSRGVALSVHKGLPLGSGLGSSAASGVAALVAVDALFESLDCCLSLTGSPRGRLRGPDRSCRKPPARPRFHG